MVAECILEVTLTEIVRAGSDEAHHTITPHGSLETLGYQVGYRFVERVIQSKVISTEHLEAMKFICKDFWNEIFGKQIDKLQTNHRGVFVLKDHTFRWLTRLSSSDDATVQTAATHLLQFPCGLIRGALANLGIAAAVTAEHISPPGCSFNIRVAAKVAAEDKPAAAAA